MFTDEEKFNKLAKSYNITNGDTIQDLICNIVYNSCGIEGNNLNLPDTTELLYGSFNQIGRAHV